MVRTVLKFLQHLTDCERNHTAIEEPSCSIHPSKLFTNSVCYASGTGMGDTESYFVSFAAF